MNTSWTNASVKLHSKVHFVKNPRSTQYNLNCRWVLHENYFEPHPTMTTQEHYYRAGEMIRQCKLTQS